MLLNQSVVEVQKNDDHISILSQQTGDSESIVVMCPVMIPFQVIEGNATQLKECSDQGWQSCHVYPNSLMKIGEDLFRFIDHSRGIIPDGTSMMHA